MDAFAFGYQVPINTYSSNWCLSGSVLSETSWIRIRIEDADPDSGGQKVAKKRADQLFFIHFETQNLIFPLLFSPSDRFLPPWVRIRIHLEADGEPYLNVCESTSQSFLYSYYFIYTVHWLPYVEVEWPVSLILNHKALAQYQMLFRSVLH